MRRPSTTPIETHPVAAPLGLEASTFTLEQEEYVIFAFALPEISLPPGLTRSEQAVVRGVLAGQSNAEIAKSRRTSSNTVANQLRAVYSKLGVASRLELTRYCVTTSGGGAGPDTAPPGKR
jgi:DNA-binding NarL/FixJ family response regulator